MPFWSRPQLVEAARRLSPGLLLERAEGGEKKTKQKPHKKKKNLKQPKNCPGNARAQPAPSGPGRPAGPRPTLRGGPGAKRAGLPPPAVPPTP